MRFFFNFDFQIGEFWCKRSVFCTVRLKLAKMPFPVPKTPFTGVATGKDP